MIFDLSGIVIENKHFDKSITHLLIVGALFFKKCSFFIKSALSGQYRMLPLISKYALDLLTLYTKICHHYHKLNF